MLGGFLTVDGRLQKTTNNNNNNNDCISNPFYFFLLQLLQRFRLEYHHEPLDLRQKLLTVPDQPLKIKFVDRL